MFCSKCGKPNEESARFCAHCGAPLGAGGGSGGGAIASQEEYYRAYLGPTNTAYYLERFKRFDDAGAAGSGWNWPAFFLTFYWMLYRKMWLPSIIYMVAPYLVLFVAGIASGAAGDSGAIIVGIGYLLILVAQFIVVPMYANAIYYHHCRKRIAEAQAESQDLQRTLGTLSGRGGTSWIPVIILGALLVVAMIGILAAIAIPQFNMYRAKAEMTGAVSYAQQAGDAVAKYYYHQQEIPASLEEAGFNGALPNGVKSISLDSDNGVVTIVMSSSGIADKSFSLTPELDEQGSISWSCGSDEIARQYLPNSCKPEE